MDRIKSFLRIGALVGLAAPLLGQPILRLTVPSTLQQSSGNVQPVWIETGTGGPTDLMFEAWNDGDGSLSLSISSGAAWLQPELGASQQCSFDFTQMCQVIRVLFDAAGLAEGTYESFVEVRDSGAIDAPQRVRIRIHVGGDVPERIDLYIAPEEENTDAVEFQTPRGPAPTITPSGGFLSVLSSGLSPVDPGANRPIHMHRVAATFQPGLPVGDTEGSIAISGSTFGPDNRTVPVTLHVTNEPILAYSPKEMQFSSAEGVELLHARVQQAVTLSNQGNGELVVSSVEVETESGGDWLSTEDLGDGVYLAKATVGDLTPGFYSGTVRFMTNAVNPPAEIPVSFEVEEAGAPEVNFRGVVNGASFDPTIALARGAIVSLFGTQLALEVQTSENIPLPRSMASTRVLVDGIEAPLYFVTYNQINFQIPNEVAFGMITVQVERDGMPGNSVSAVIASQTPGIFVWPGLGLYGIIENHSQGRNCPLPPDVPCPTGRSSSPARPGDVLVLWVHGLGPTDPPVGTGEGSPFDPLASAATRPLVFFGNNPFGTPVFPEFAGLSPGLVGLFQVNVRVPNVGTNPRLAVSLQFSGTLSNIVEIAVAR